MANGSERGSSASSSGHEVSATGNIASARDRKNRAPGSRRTANGNIPAADDFSTEMLRSMLDQLPINVMFANTEGVIVYMNEASKTTLRSIEYVLPVKVDEILGRSFDVFHKNPAHQRRMVADPRVWPHRATIALGPERLRLYGTAVHSGGEFVGVMQTWEVVTKQLEIEQQNQDYKSNFDAISRAQGVIQFDLEGRVLEANDNFLRLLGYSLDEVKGRHHSTFVDDGMRQSSDYSEFWAKLRRGEFVAGEFRRVAKGGREVFIQASYNPILDLNGKPYKVVKYATDVTAQVRMRRQMEDVLKGVMTSAQQLGAASNELSSVSQQMSATAEETASQANTVSAAAEEVSVNVQTVAAGTEEMSASIREIAKSAADAARVASAAVGVAANTNATVAKLGDSSAEVGNVVKVITSIAQQTKLLALNATIEAARAGEAGKGFAVVANEVKELAKETAKATEDISAKIEAIQTDTRGAVVAIGEISRIINQINDLQGTIASAVEEQTATTNEMSRNVAEGAKGANEIARNITSVAQAAQDTTSGASKALTAAQTLAGMARTLESLVADFES